MIGRRTKFDATLMKLGQPHSAHQVQLIDRQCLLERGTLVIVIPGSTVRRGQIHPQDQLGWITVGGLDQIFDGLVDVTRLERVQPKVIEAVRIGLGQGLSAQ